MSIPSQARVELGTAGSDIAGNIDVLLPQLAARGAEVATAANQIHDKLLQLRKISHEFRASTEPTIQEVAFDKVAEEIKAILPQLSGHGLEVDSVANAIKGYCNQLETIHAQHLHLVDEHAAPIAGQPVVNNGIGGGPYETGVSALPTVAKIEEGFDPNPKPAGEGTVKYARSSEEAGKAELV